MVEEGDFIRAILAAPDDDTPRLVFADWLEERGDPRGEFIRVQCALAREDNRTGRQHRELSARQSELVRAHPEWVRPVEPLGLIGTDPDRSGLFRRGFVEDLATVAGTFLARGDELFRAAPLLRHVRLIGLDAAGARALAGSPYLGRLTKLDLDGGPYGDNRVGDVGAEALAGAAGLSRVAELGLANNGITDAGARALAASPHVAGLTWLDLGDNQIGEAGVQALIDSTTLAGLTALGLRNNPGGGVVCHYDYDIGTRVGAELDRASAERLQARFRQRLRVF